MFAFDSTKTYAAGENGPPNNMVESFNSETIKQQEGIFINEDENLDNGNVVSLNKDPCPQPKTAYSETPNDLKVIQEDITRFTLCVQRAQLLERLNSLALENTSTIDSALDASIENMASQFSPSITNVQAPAMPITTSLQNEPAYEQELTQQTTWLIHDIKGQQGALTATLVNDQGHLVNVKKGNSLPDKISKITSLSATEVIISKDGQTTKLLWE